MSTLRMKMNKNRYLYQVYMSTKNSSGVGKLVRLITSAIRILPKRCFNMWDYVDDIRNNNFVVNLKEYDGIKMYVPYFMKDGIQRIIANSEDFFERDVLRDLSNSIYEHATIMDIGANIGNHTVFFGKVCKADKVYSFEPVEGTYSILKKNIEINGLSNIVESYNVACGRSEGSASIVSFNETNIGGTVLEEKSGGRIRILSLDEMKIPDRIDFIKIDVEGFELSVLEGAKRLIDRDKPLIFIEVWDENKDKVDRFFHEREYHLAKKFEGNNYLFSSNVKRENR